MGGSAASGSGAGAVDADGVGSAAVGDGSADVDADGAGAASPSGSVAPAAHPDRSRTMAGRTSSRLGMSRPYEVVLRDR
ncbi:hypothetical protein GCM10009846_17850 [Agrococcus versicolor]|uniref:Uncharacterized protein n=1 Tax=Agrococcus versicolor TaxID=501482 RepID=A0ABN3ARJ7_9MICO